MLLKWNRIWYIPIRFPHYSLSLLDKSSSLSFTTGGGGHYPPLPPLPPPLPLPPPSRLSDPTCPNFAIPANLGPKVRVWQSLAPLRVVTYMELKCMWSQPSQCTTLLVSTHQRLVIGCPCIPGWGQSLEGLGKTCWRALLRLGVCGQGCPRTYCTARSPWGSLAPSHAHS